MTDEEKAEKLEELRKVFVPGTTFYLAHVPNDSHSLFTIASNHYIDWITSNYVCVFDKYTRKPILDYGKFNYSAIIYASKEGTAKIVKSELDIELDKIRQMLYED